MTKTTSGKTSLKYILKTIYDKVCKVKHAHTGSAGRTWTETVVPTAAQTTDGAVLNLRRQSMTNEECDCTCICECVCETCRGQKGPAGLKLYPGARSLINGRILMTLVCVCRWEDINALPASSHSRANWRSCQESQHGAGRRGPRRDSRPAGRPVLAGAICKASWDTVSRGRFLFFFKFQNGENRDFWGWRRFKQMAFPLSNSVTHPDTHSHTGCCFCPLTQTFPQKKGQKNHLPPFSNQKPLSLPQRLRGGREAPPTPVHPTLTPPGFL